MKRNVWIFNHYASGMYFNVGGRHYWFAKYLKKAGYNPVIFCANTVHGSDEKMDTQGKLYIIKHDDVNNIPFVFVNVSPYKGNGVSRVKNMASFYRQLFKIAKKILNEYEKPDVILASSVHPLTLVAGIKIAKRFKIKCICEIRDLWPESLVAIEGLKRTSVLTRILYEGEKWIYKKADALIFTMEGGKRYIQKKKWDKKNGGPIDIEKVNYINNGIDLQEALEQREAYPYSDERFDSIRNCKIIYTGSIRKANDVGKLLDTAKLLKGKEITFCVFGDGNERESLEKRVKEENIDNVIFFGKVEKRYIPNIVSQAHLLLLLYSKGMAQMAQYGMSQNKFFAYLVAGKAIISNLPNKYSIINKYNCGVEREILDAADLAAQIERMIDDEDALKQWGMNAGKALEEFSFERHTEKLIAIIERL